MTRYLSDKFIVLNTILVIMVVFIHSSFNEAAQYPVAPYIQRFIGGACRIANCMFFCHFRIFICSEPQIVKRHS